MSSPIYEAIKCRSHKLFVFKTYISDLDRTTLHASAGKLHKVNSQNVKLKGENAVEKELATLVVGHHHLKISHHDE